MIAKCCNVLIAGVSVGMTFSHVEAADWIAESRHPDKRIVPVIYRGY